MTSPHEVLLLVPVPVVIFAGYLVFGITGFGASPITIPGLVHLLPLAFVGKGAHPRHGGDAIA